MSQHQSSTHGSHDSHGHDAHGAHDVSKSVRKYMLIFGVLLIGTIITVLASYVNFGSHTANVVVALIIATIKAGLVAGYFMHLLDERKLIFSVLAATTFFFAALMYLTLWSMEPLHFIHIKQ